MHKFAGKCQEFEIWHGNSRKNLKTIKISNVVKFDRIRDTDIFAIFATLPTVLVQPGTLAKLTAPPSTVGKAKMSIRSFLQSMSTQPSFKRHSWVSSSKVQHSADGQ